MLTEDELTRACATVGHHDVESLIAALTATERSLLRSDDIDGAVHNDSGHEIVDAACSLQDKRLLTCHAVTDTEGWWDLTDFGATVRRALRRGAIP